MYSNDELESILVKAIRTHQSLDTKEYLIDSVTEVFVRLEELELLGRHGEGCEVCLKSGNLGNLSQIANMLQDEMRKYIERDGYSDSTLNLESAIHGIRDIIEMNNIKE